MMPGPAARFRGLAFSPSEITPSRLSALVSAIWENRSEIPYAWKILNHGACDGCSIGSRGLQGPLGEFHLCAARLELLRRNTMPPIGAAALGDVERLRRLESHRLRSLGRLAHPMIRRKGQRGFLRVSWNEATEVIAKQIRRTMPGELSFLATPQGRTSEVYYIVQKLARALGTNNLDLCAAPNRRVASGALKTSLGFDASTCSLSDVIGTDLLAAFGSDKRQIHEILDLYRSRAQQAATRIVAVNSSGENAVASAKLQRDDVITLRPGGDGAFIAGVLRFLLLAERVTLDFIDQHTAGFAELAAELATLSWDGLEQRSGVDREAMQRFSESYGRARSAVFLCAPDHEDSLGAIVNLALARGMIGKEKAGILLIRDGSGEQSALECGMAPDVFPGGYDVGEEAARRFSNLWHHPVPSQPGLKASAMLGAAEEGRIKILYTLGCDPWECASYSASVEAALSRVLLRVHQDTLLNASMLLDPADTVVLLPGQTRYQQRAGGISTGTDRTIRFTPEIPGHDPGETLPDWEIPILIGRRAMSNGDKLFPFSDTQTIREEMGRVMPIYQGIERLTEEGDELQWGGAQLYKEGFAHMPQGRARFTTARG